MKIPHIGTSLNGPNSVSTIKLIESLGGGSFGDVFKAIEISNDKIRYAVKFPRVASLSSKREITAFFNEVEAAKNFEHPNVVKIVHVETSDTSYLPYLVMEYLPNGTLNDFLNSQNKLLNVGIVRQWTNQLIEGISYINSKMLHRDLKPDNILIDDTNLKIGDFGLSKVVDALTRTNTFKGRQHILYMAPEGWKFEKNSIQIDMYAMGIVLFQLATLQYPYQYPQNTDNFDSFRDMHFFQIPKTVQSMRKDLPLSFSQVISRLMEKRPENRFSDWDEVKATLQNCWQSYDSVSYKVDDFSIIAQIFEQEHQAQTKRRLEREKSQSEQEEAIQRNAYQREKLADEIKNIVNEFNTQYPLTQISVRDNRGIGQFHFNLPYNLDSLILKFIDIKPSIVLTKRNWKINFAAYLYSESDYGFNLLLCHEHEEDLYGKWYCCKVTQHPFIAKPKPPEPFGFRNNQEMQDHLAKSDLMTHAYEVEFSADIQQEFLSLLRMLLSQ